MKSLALHYSICQHPLMKLFRIFLFVLIPLCAHAAKWGDAAAPLQISEWVKGDAVDLAAGKGKNIYVVEFWATWCGPCRQSIPHLTELQKKYKDQGVVFVGISDEESDTVKKFVKKMGAKMEYTVAVDDGKKTSAAYMDAFGQEGIPTAFVVDKQGAVVWVGHPMEGLDRTLEQLVAGKFNAAAAAKEADTKAEREKLFEDYFQIAEKDKAKAAKLGDMIISEFAANAQSLNEFAWKILTTDGLKHRDLPLALRAAKKAHEVATEDAAIADTYARALLAAGKNSEAIEMQKKAVALSHDNKERLQLKETLSEYEHPVLRKKNLLAIDDNDLIDRFNDEARRLIEKGKTVSLAKLLEQADVKPYALKLAPPPDAVSSERLYEHAKSSILIIGTMTKDTESDSNELTGNFAGGFVIGESGVFVTNFHVLDQPDAETLLAMTADGHVFPVKSVLAASEADDIAICQLDGASGLKPLPLGADAAPGAHVRVLSHPDWRFYTMTEGIVSRYFVMREDGKTTTWFSTTADFAGGASGGPLFNDHGAVIGMVASTESIYSGDENDETKQGDLQMVVKACVPVANILKLIKPKP